MKIRKLILEKIIKEELMLDEKRDLATLLEDDDEYVPKVDRLRQGKAYKKYMDAFDANVIDKLHTIAADEEVRPYFGYAGMAIKIGSTKHFLKSVGVESEHLRNVLAGGFENIPSKYWVGVIEH